MILVNLIKDYRELALSARCCGNLFRNMIEIDWEVGNDDRSEWDERKSNVGVSNG